MKIAYGSLFTGIGGLDLGVEEAMRELGIDVKCAWQVEQDPFCRAVLEKHWPAVDRTITDVRFAGATSLVRTDLIVGGFPCQDVSGAGAGAGLAGARSGLWFEFLRIVGELRPRFVVVENVASGKRRWLCQVRYNLQALGYRTRAVQISAADVGAPQLRERVFVIAIGDADGARGLQQEGIEQDERRWPRDRGQDGDVADAVREHIRLEPRRRGWQDGTGAPEPGDAGQVADADAGRRGKRPGALEGEAGCAEPANGGELGDANCARLEGWAGESGDDGTQFTTTERASGMGARDRQSFAGQGGLAHSDEHGSARHAEPGLGRATSRFSARLDGHRWPAFRGQVQHPWEAPRIIGRPPKSYHKDLQGEEVRAFIEGARNRRARLKALGNTVVPQCARVATLVLMEWAMTEERIAS